MTCIVGLTRKGRVYMGADSCVTVGATCVPTPEPKIVRFAGMLIGCAGSVRTARLVASSIDGPESLCDELRRVFAEGGAITRGPDEFDGELLVAYRGVLLHIGSDFGLVQIGTPYFAIGSGGDVALGALHATPRSLTPRVQLRRALQASADLCDGVRGPFRFATL